MGAFGSFDVFDFLPVDFGVFCTIFSRASSIRADSMTLKIGSISSKSDSEKTFLIADVKNSTNEVVTFSSVAGVLDSSIGFDEILECFVHILESFVVFLPHTFPVSLPFL